MSKGGTGKRPRILVEREVDSEDLPPLTKAQIRELRRRIRDSEDRTRYLLVSALTEKHALYYNVSEDTFGWREPSFGTLFKRRQAAQAIKQLLTSHVQLAACRVTRRGRLVLSSIPRVRASWTRSRKGRIRHSLRRR